MAEVDQHAKDIKVALDLILSIPEAQRSAALDLTPLKINALARLEAAADAGPGTEHFFTLLARKGEIAKKAPDDIWFSIEELIPMLQKIGWDLKPSTRFMEQGTGIFLLHDNEAKPIEGQSFHISEEKPVNIRWQAELKGYTQVSYTPRLYIGNRFIGETEKNVTTAILTATNNHPTVKTLNPI
jgi:hypothetical protein